MNIELKQEAEKALEYLRRASFEVRNATLVEENVSVLRAVIQQPVTGEQVRDRCAQCKKAYSPGATSVGCPKCAPGVSVAEDEFRKPLTTPEPVWFHKHWGDGDDIFYRPDDKIPPGSTPLYTRHAPSVPDGWQLVPIEPTEKMLQAALKVATPGALRAAWARMLAASLDGNHDH